MRLFRELFPVHAAARALTLFLERELYVCVVLRASCMLDRCATTEPHLQILRENSDLVTI